MDTPTRWHLYHKTEDSWLAMKEACLNARTSIDIEQYIFEQDEIGQEFLDILITKSKLGVHVRILVDMVGGYSFYSSDLPKILRDIGIQVRFFNIIKPWRISTFSSWFFRDHRKVLVIDGNTGFVGGVGIRSDMKLWRDTNVKVNGSITKEMRHGFEEMWEAAASENFFGRMKRTGKFVKGFQFITNSPVIYKRYMYRELIAAFRNAQNYIYITTPYFIPDRRLRRVLRLAANRGVDVRIIIPETSDFPPTDGASRTYFDGLLSAGARIFLYTEKMIHAKTAVVDDNWSTVGSFNLDYLSFFYNYEANIVSTKEGFALEVKGLFNKDLLQSKEIHLDEWRKRGILKKISEYMWLPFRRFL